MKNRNFSFLFPAAQATALVFVRKRVNLYKECIISEALNVNLHILVVWKLAILIFGPKSSHQPQYGFARVTQKNDSQGFGLHPLLQSKSREREFHLWAEYV